MRAPMQRKYAIAWRIGGARAGEKPFFTRLFHILEIKICSLPGLDANAMVCKKKSKNLVILYIVIRTMVL